MKELDKIELKKEEIQNILKRPPHILVRVGTSTICIAVLIFLIIGYFIKSPDVVDCDISVKMDKPLIQIFAQRDGLIDCIVDFDNNNLKSKDIIAVYANSLNIKDLLELKKHLNQCVISDSILYIPDGLIKCNFQLGEIGVTYLSFLKAMSAFEKRMGGDFISESYNVKNRNRDFLDLNIAYVELLSNIQNWEFCNLIYSPIGGEIINNSNIKNGQIVSKDEKLFTIIPNEIGRIIVTIKFPPEYRNKIELNQRINIETNNLLGELHLFDGKVDDVSFLADEDCYVVDVYIYTDYKPVSIPMTIRNFTKAKIILNENSFLQRILISIKTLI